MFDTQEPGLILTEHGVDKVVKRYEIDYFDKENPRSIYNLVPPFFQKKLEDQDPDSELYQLICLDEVALQQHVKPTPTANRLRISFWHVYDKTQNMNKSEMDMASVYGGICSRIEFLRNILEVKSNLAWLLKPPTDYVRAMEEALNFGVGRIREILDFPLYTRKGEPDHKAAELVLKTVAMLDMRVKGALVQKVQIEQKSMNYNQITYKSEEDIDELDKKLRQLQGEVKDIQTLEHPLKESQMPALEYKEEQVIESRESSGAGEVSKKKTD